MKNWDAVYSQSVITIQGVDLETARAVAYEKLPKGQNLLSLCVSAEPNLNLDSALSKLIALGLTSNEALAIAGEDTTPIV